MEPVLKKTIIFPIEIANRELQSKSLLAIEMAKKGFRVYLGSFRAIDEIHKSIPSCVYFHKSAIRPSKLKKYKRKMGAVIAILDEEIGPTIPAYRIKEEISARFKTLTNEFYDYVFMLGDKHKEIACSMQNMNGIKIYSHGWPRIDLWRQEFFTIYESEVNKLNRIHGDFILFVSSFGIISKKALNYYLPTVATESEKEAFRISFNAFNSYLPILKVIAKTAKKKLIIRPHPSESIGEWRNLFSGMTNVVVSRDGDVSPWLLAAKKVISYRSTATLQAALNAIPTYQYRIDKTLEEHQSVVYDISKCIDSKDQLLDELDLPVSLEDGQKIQKLTYTLLRETINSLDGSFASEKISKILSDADVQPIPPVFVGRAKKIFSFMWNRYKFLEHILRKSVLKKFSSYRPSRFDKLPDGIRVNHIEKFLRELHQSNPKYFPEVVCRQVSIDLVSIELRHHDQ